MDNGHILFRDVARKKRGEEQKCLNEVNWIVLTRRDRTMVEEITLHDEIAMKRHGVSYDELDDEQRSIVDELIERALSLW